MRDDDERDGGRPNIALQVFLGLVLFFIVLPMATCGGCLTYLGARTAQRQEAERR